MLFQSVAVKQCGQDIRFQRRAAIVVEEMFQRNQRSGSEKCYSKPSVPKEEAFCSRWSKQCMSRQSWSLSKMCSKASDQALRSWVEELPWLLSSEVLKRKGFREGLKRKASSSSVIPLSGKSTPYPVASKTRALTRVLECGLETSALTHSTTGPRPVSWTCKQRGSL